MSKPEISVIVAVYNVEKYLHRCVNSILAQEYSDFEILLIDDGSTDSSGSICDEYAQIDSRVKVIHKKNGGLADTRNCGIDNSTGKKLCFIDGDDFIEKDYLSTLDTLIENNNADMASCVMKDCYEGGKIVEPSVFDDFTCDGIEAYRLTLEGAKIPISACVKLIKRDSMNGLYFSKGRVYEDAILMPDLMLKMKKVAVSHKPLYIYWHRAGSITTKPFSNRDLDVIYAYNHAMDMVKEVSPEIIPEVQFRLYWAHFVVLDKMLGCKNYNQFSQYKEIVQYLKKNWLRIVKCSYFQKSRRIAAVALKINVSLYRILFLIYEKKKGANE